MAIEQQTSYNADISIAGWIRNWAGQRLTITNRTVTHLSFVLNKYGSPSGVVTFEIRKVSDNSLIMSKAWGTADNLQATGSEQWEEVEFDTPTFINEEVRIVVYYPTDVSNFKVELHYQNTDVKASEYVTYHDGSWNAVTSADAAYKYTYTEEGSAAPVVTTQECTNVTAPNALGNGNLQSLGTSAVTQHGHCWATTSSPTTSSDGLAENGPTANLGPFTSPITSLTPGTKYYVRAYATNTTGTSYGANVEIAGDITTIGKRYWWVEGKEFHYFDQYGDERKIEGVPDASGLPWWWYY